MKEVIYSREKNTPGNCVRWYERRVSVVTRDTVLTGCTGYRGGNLAVRWGWVRLDHPEGKGLVETIMRSGHTPRAMGRETPLVE